MLFLNMVCLPVALAYSLATICAFAEFFVLIWAVVLLSEAIHWERVGKTHSAETDVEADAEDGQNKRTPTEGGCHD
jgi:hypothetical protein